MAITVAMRTQVSQLYVSLFGRAPDGEGLGFWVNKLDSGQTMAQVAQQMYDVPAARTYYKSYATNEEIVATFYQNVLGRAVGNDTEGQAFWVAKMNKPGATKGDVFAELLSTVVNYAGTDPNGVTSKALFNNRVSVAQFYGEQNGSIDGATNALVGVTSDAATVVTAKSAAATSASSTSGGTFTLTTGSDVLNLTTTTAANKTTTGDDIIYANTDGFLTSADIIDAGAGNDTINAGATSNNQTLAPILTSVETVTITQTAADAKQVTFDGVNTTGLTTLNVKNAGAVSADRTGTILGFATTSDELILLKNLAKTTTVGIIGGTASTGTTSADITAQFTGVAAADTQKLAISTAGKVNIVTLQTAETVEITATGNGSSGANTINSLIAQSVKTLNIKGTGDLTISASDLAAAPTIDASTTTGVIAFTGETAATTTTFKGGSGATTVSTASTGIVNVTTGTGADVVDFLTAANTATVSTGAGNDEVRVGAQAQVTSTDSIDGGDGIDTITISDATINGTTKTALVAGIKNFEVVKTTAVAEVSIDFNALSTWDIVSVTSASTVTAQAAAAASPGLAGLAAVAATMENPDAIWISANRTGMVGQAATNVGVDISGAGGAGLSIAPRIDNGNNAANLKLIGNVTLTGGAGGASAAGAGDLGGDGGSALSASSIEVLNLDISGTNATGVAADTVTFTAGAGGAAGAAGTAGAAGSGIVVGTNATINITSSLTGSTAVVNNNLTLGTVVGTNVTINASTFAGKLSVTAASGNVTITGGTAADILTGGAGNDTISGGAGADVITGGAASDLLTGGAGRDSFTIATAGHSATTTTTGNVTFDKISDFGKASVAATAAQVTAMNTVANFQATATAQGGAEADILDMATTATLAAAATGTNVTAAVVTNPVVTANISAKGVVTVAGAGASLVDTLAEWIAVAKIMTANDNVAVFEFSGNTYVYQEGAGGDDVVELTGVTGVTGIVLAGGAVAAAPGDVFVI